MTTTEQEKWRSKDFVLPLSDKETINSLRIQLRDSKAKLGEFQSKLCDAYELRQASDIKLKELMKYLNSCETQLEHIKMIASIMNIALDGVPDEPVPVKESKVKEEKPRTKKERFAFAIPDRKDVDGLLEFCQNMGEKVEPFLLAKLKETFQLWRLGEEEKISSLDFFKYTLIENESMYGPHKLASSFRLFDRFEESDKLLAYASFNNIETPSDIEFISADSTVTKFVGVLKENLSRETLDTMTHTRGNSFTNVMKDLFALGSLESTLDRLYRYLEKANHEQLKSEIKQYEETFRNMHYNEFQQQVIKALDYSDVGMKAMLDRVRNTLHKHLLVRLLDEDLKTYWLDSVYCELTFQEYEDKALTRKSDTGANELDFLLKEQNKNKIDFERVLTLANALGKFFTLIGNPGCGKTYFCKHLLSLYNKYVLPFRFCIYLACRDYNWQEFEKEQVESNDKISIVDLKKKFLMMALPDDKTISEYVAKQIMCEDGDHTIFILDGFDEFPQFDFHNFRKTVLYKILLKSIFPKSTILLTSRPGAFSDLVKLHSQDITFETIIELIGFSSEQRKEFAKLVLDDDEYDEFRKLINVRREISALTLVPINASLLVSLIQYQRTHKSNLSNITNLTELYKHFCFFSIHRQFKRLNQHERLLNLTDFDGLPANIVENLLVISVLAYRGIKERKITFGANEVVVPNTDLPKGLGILTEASEVKMGIRGKQLSFIHLTFQEFLAAYHLRRLDLDAFKEELKEIAKPENWEVYRIVMRFLCGLLQDGECLFLLFDAILTQLMFKTMPNYSIFRPCFETLSFLSDDIDGFTPPFETLAPYILELQTTTKFRPTIYELLKNKLIFPLYMVNLASKLDMNLDLRDVFVFEELPRVKLLHLTRVPSVYIPEADMIYLEISLSTSSFRIDELHINELKSPILLEFTFRSEISYEFYKLIDFIPDGLVGLYFRDGSRNELSPFSAYHSELLNDKIKINKDTINYLMFYNMQISLEPELELFYHRKNLKTFGIGVKQIKVTQDLLNFLYQQTCLEELYLMTDDNTHLEYLNYLNGFCNLKDFRMTIDLNAKVWENDEFCNKYIETYERNSGTLEYLDFKGYFILFDIKKKELLTMISTCTAIRNLKLSGCFLTQEDVPLLRDSLQFLQCLIELTLSANLLSNGSLEQFQNNLNISTMKKLDLSLCSFSYNDEMVNDVLAVGKAFRNLCIIQVGLSERYKLYRAVTIINYHLGQTISS